MSPLLLIKDALNLLRSLTKCPPTSQVSFKCLNTPTHCIQSGSHRPPDSASGSTACTVFREALAQLLPNCRRPCFPGTAGHHHCPLPPSQPISPASVHLQPGPSYQLSCWSLPPSLPFSPSFTLAAKGLFLEYTSEMPFPPSSLGKTPIHPSKHSLNVTLSLSLSLIFLNRKLLP